MKKSIFLSVLALAAVVSCQKSEIVDTKYNDAIGFETYLGRDAQAKADIIETAHLDSYKVFGYYGGLNTWTEGQSELWAGGLEIAKGSQPSGDDVRYWTNTTDLYSFLAYAPVGDATLTEGTGNTLSYTVNNDFTNVDVLVAEPQCDRTKGDGTVALTLKHRTARLTVKTTIPTSNCPFDFRVKSISLKGSFYNLATISLVNPTSWTGTLTNEVEYTFHNADDVETAITTQDYAETNKGYLMLIPVTAANHNAVLTLVYTTYDPVAKQESREYTVKYDIENDFDMGKAYALNLEFSTDATPIQFSVTVDPAWTNDTVVMTPQVAQN